MLDLLIADRFGHNLARQRRLSGLSQEELAEVTHMHRTGVASIERGQSVPRLDTLLKLSAGVESPPCELLDGLRWRPGHYVDGRFYIESDAADPESSAGA